MPLLFTLVLAVGIQLSQLKAATFDEIIRTVHGDVGVTLIQVQSGAQLSIGTRVARLEGGRLRARGGHDETRLLRWNAGCACLVDICVRATAFTLRLSGCAN